MKKLLLCLICFMLILSACTGLTQSAVPPQGIPPTANTDESYVDSLDEQEIEPEPAYTPQVTIDDDSQEEYNSESEFVDGYGHGIGEEIQFGIFRPIFYDLPAPFVDLIGTEIYLEWLQSRSQEERNSENIAVSFIRDFDISKEDFILANERLAQIWESVGASADENSSFELYPVDLIFSFDNKAINEFFLWENSPVEEERHLGHQAH